MAAEEILITLSLNSLAVVLQLIALFGNILAAYFSYIIYTYNRLSKAWLAITVAISIQVARRLIGVIDVIFNIKSLPPIIEFLDRPLIPAIFSILIAIGLWQMKKNFEDLDSERRKQSDWVCFYKGKIKNSLKSVKK